VFNRPFGKRIRSIQRNLLDFTVRRNPSLGLDKRAEDIVKLFENQISAQSQVLDIGGGWGFYAKPLAERGHHLTVLDVVKPGYQKAPVVIYGGNEPFPFPDKSFDASMFITVLHHIPDHDLVIREAKRVTKKTLIVVEDIYHHALGRFWTVLRDRFYNFEYFGHPCRFKKSKDWISLFTQYGFTLIEKKQVRTQLAGLPILNGVFVFRVND
jgi:ubiquinone/menaquinone biosynthesis C-methylase UbiE